MSDLDFARFMAADAERAVQTAAADYGVTLDYSEESVRAVEVILGRVADTRPRGFLARLFRQGPSNAELWAHARQFGAYLGEVMRREWGGEWRPPHPEIGEAYVTFAFAGNTIWPTAKALKRLLNGAEDNVWIYYQVLRPESPLLETANEPDAEGVRREGR